MSNQYSTKSTLKQLKFVHTADLHLDTPFKGLATWNPSLAERMRDATYRSLVSIINLCINEKVDFLLVAGDIFDSENASLAAQIKFLDELKRLTEQNIPVYFICGNHDHLGAWDSSFVLPEGVYRFGSSHVEKITFSRGGKPAADIYGISYGSSHIRESLVPLYKKTGGAAPVSIAMLHGMADVVGYDEKYAPFRLGELLETTFDYWALGHVHKHRVLSRDPLVVYPGNPQGRDFGETGSRGCYLVEMKEGGKPEARFVPVHHIRFEEVDIDLNGVDSLYDMNDLIGAELDKVFHLQEAGRFMVRIRLTGRTELHRRLMRSGETEQMAEELNSRYGEGEHFLFVDSIELLTSLPVDVEKLAGGKDFTGELVRTIRHYEADEARLEGLVEKIVNELPAARIFRETGELSMQDKRDALERAKWLLLERLAGGPDNEPPV
ncbi:MAG: DNA repair exonuclease [Marinilabiliales bacterium]|nr:MAG: DNA repair exonuclease [Marinilabiliales bacterium]